MTTITLSKSLKARAQARAAERGCQDLSEYVRRLIDEDSPAPIDEDLERTLLKRLNGRSREITAAGWEAKRRSLRQMARRTKINVHP